MQKLIRDLGAGRLAMLGIAAVLLLSMFVFLALRLASPTMAPLYADLAPDDSNRVVAQLSAMGVQYKLQAGGSQVLVPSDQIPSLRARMAEEGVPSKGAIVGYEIFDKSDMMGSSNFVQNVNLVRALEGELARTLAGFAKVSAARVHIVLPKREVFSKKGQDPSASVVLKVKGGQTLERTEIAAISHLVASAVPGLEPQRVTIVDVRGNPLKLANDDENDPSMVASNTEQFRIQFQNNMKQKIETLLEHSVGAGKVVAQVTADINFDRVVTNSEIYDPDGQVARTIQSTEEKENSADGAGGADQVTVQNNLPGGAKSEAGAGGGAKSSNSVQRTNETTNFEISKTVKNHISESGSVKKLSVAVLVDGLYEPGADGAEPTYKPRSPEELQKLEALIKSSIGFDETRGDRVQVENMQFTHETPLALNESPMAWLTQDIGGVIQTLVIGVVVTLIILLVVKPMVGRAFEIGRAENEEAELQAALAGVGDLKSLAGEVEAVQEPSETAIDIERFEEKMKSSSLGTINEIVDRHPDETITIIRNWMGNEG